MLPRLPNQPQKRKRSNSESASAKGPGSEPSVTVTVKNVKGGEPVSLPRQPLSVSAFDLKTAYAKEAGVPVDKVRLLFNKKPVADSKTLKDVLGPAAGKPSAEVAFSAMVMGGAVAAPAKAASLPAEAPEPDTMAQQAAPSGQELLETEDFWSDLKSFLTQRIKDDAEGERLVDMFRSTWEKSGQ